LAASNDSDPDAVKSLVCELDGIAQLGNYNNTATLTISTSDNRTKSCTAQSSYYGIEEPTPPGCPGTGTIGYWKTHPEAWPVDTITIGGKNYSKEQAIALMKRPGKGDKSIDLFKQLVATKLNIEIGNSGSCIEDTVIAADDWLAEYGVGTDIDASSDAWAVGGPLHQELDDYNNGRLECAVHRDTVQCVTETPHCDHHGKPGDHDKCDSWGKCGKDKGGKDKGGKDHKSDKGGKSMYEKFRSDKGDKYRLNAKAWGDKSGKSH
jgi:hypothetical protein